MVPGSISSWKLVKTIPGSEWRFETQTCLQLAVEQDLVRKFAGLCLGCSESSLLTQWGMFLWEALHQGCSGNEIRALPRLHTKCLWCRQEGFVIPSCKHLQNPSGQNGAGRIAKISVQLQKLLKAGQLCQLPDQPLPRPWHCPLGHGARHRGMEEVQEAAGG